MYLQPPPSLKLKTNWVFPDFKHDYDAAWDKEQDFQSAMCAFFAENGIYSQRLRTTDSVGSPDMIICYKGKFVAIELKAKRGTISKQQLKHMRDVHHSGGHGIVAHTILEVLLFLEEI